MRGIVTVPNLVSAFRVGLVPVFLWLVLAVDEPGWAGLLLGFIGATDWVDGTLARRLGQISQVGKFLDPLADRLAVAAAVIAGLVTGVLPPWFAWALIAREALIALGAIWGWTRGVAQLEVRWLGKAATFGLYFATSFYYVGEGFDLDPVVLLAHLCAVPALVMYYVVAAMYFADMRAAVASRHSEPTG